MTLMAGPVDARVSPTRVNELSTSHPIEWFEQNLISTVPARFRGANRRVYPGFVQLLAFVSMNLERHVEAHWELYNDLADRRGREGEDDLVVLRRVLRGRRSCRRVLPRNREEHVPGLRARARRSLEFRGPAREPGGDRAHRAAHRRGRTRRRVRHRPDDGGARVVHAGSARIASATICSPASDTTASSAAAAGRNRSTRWCAT